MPSIRDVVGAATYQKIGQALSESFPDVRARVTDQHVDAMFVTLWETQPPSVLASMGVPAPPTPTFVAEQRAALEATSPGASGGGLVYYDASANHHRIYPPGDRFIGTLPMVRVTLPPTQAGAGTVATAIGDYLPQDHLFSSVAQLEWEYHDELQAAAPGSAVTRVDCIGPARKGGARFGAVSIYLGYRDGAALPSFWIVETGFATGQAAVPHLSADMSPIVTKRSYYQPTPFASDRNYYSATLTMSGDDPASFHIEVRNQTWVPAHLVIDVTFAKPPSPSGVWPFFLTAEAGARVGLIAEKMGVQTPERILAPVGDLLPWIQRPT